MVEEIDLKKNEGKGHETNYLTFFVMGIIWVVFGIAINLFNFQFGLSIVFGMPWLILGPIFLSLGLANRDKWNKNGWL